MYSAFDREAFMGSPLPGGSRRFDVPPQVTYEPFRAEDPRLVDHLSLREVSGPTQFVSTKNFAVQFYNCDGEALGSQIYTIENKTHQDVLDVVPYSESGGRLLIAMNERIRPALAARAILTEGAEPEVRGLMWNLPGRYLPSNSDPYEVETAVQTFLRSGLGLSQRDLGRRLGGTYLPSCGASPELCVMYAVPIDTVDGGSQIAFHEAFEASRHVRFVDAQEIVNSYLAGTLHDLRLVLAAFRLAKDLGYSLDVALPLSSDSRALQNAAGMIPVLDTAGVISHISAAPSDRSVVARIEAQEVSDTPQPFVRLKRFEVTNHDSRGRALETYAADLAIRRGLDAVDIGCYTWIDGRPCMLVKRGVRPVIAIRALSEHPLSTDPSPLGIEGIAESLEGERDLDSIAQRAKQGVREEAGFEPSHQPVYVGYTYPSPGVNPERVYNYLTELVPSTPAYAERTLDEQVDLFYVPVDELIELADRGIVRDPRLELNAYLLKHTLLETGLPS